MSDGSRTDTHTVSVTVINVDYLVTTSPVARGQLVSASESDSAPADLLTNDAYKTTKIVLRRIEAGIFTWVRLRRNRSRLRRNPAPSDPER